jgi:hypothetical protein
VQLRQEIAQSMMDLRCAGNRIRGKVASLIREKETAIARRSHWVAACYRGKLGNASATIRHLSPERLACPKARSQLLTRR